ncbi:MAG TPA: hypothetical protein VF777_13130 [Phycisphaerales bacterium]
MPIRSLSMTLCVALLVVGTLANIARAQNQPFTYQGKLAESGAPATGAVNLVVKLFPTDTGGSPIGTQTINGVPLIGGVFTITLNAAGEFTANPFATGADRWVELTVNGQTIAPRQKLTVAPMAAFSAAPWVLNGTTLSYTDGKVGIGTTFADRPLTLNEPSTGGGGARVAQLLSLQADQATRWHINLFSPNGSASTDYGLNFVESLVADYRLFLAKGGNIGIGTSTPSGRLEIASLNDALVIRPPTMSAGQISSIVFKDPDGGTPSTLLTFRDSGFGNVGIVDTFGSARLGVNTFSPSQTLDVRGEIAFGSSGQFSPVASGSGNIRTIFAVVNSGDGSLFSGSGLTVAKLGVGNYRVTFNPVFASFPAVFVTPISPGLPVHCSTNFLGVGQVDIDMFNAAGARVDLHFSIMVIGPR